MDIVKYNEQSDKCRDIVKYNEQSDKCRDIVNSVIYVLINGGKQMQLYNYQQTGTQVPG